MSAKKMCVVGVTGTGQGSAGHDREMSREGSPVGVFALVAD
jgi:hypothetical protein